MKLGIFTGSFNPIHKGHIHMMDYLVDNNYVDKIIIVPTNSYWDKKIDVSLEDRLNMIKCLNKQYLVVEENLNNIKYTYELLDKIQEKNPNDILYLIMGSDNIINFDKWENYRRILMYKILVLNRYNIDVADYIAKFNSSNIIYLKDFNFTDISSTELRDNINSNYIDEKVLAYIKKRNLYQK